MHRKATQSAFLPFSGFNAQHNHRRPIMSRSSSNTSAGKQPAQHLAWLQRAGVICPLVSPGLYSELSYGLPEGSVWLGDIWLRLVLCNPQPSPSARRPRCAEDASLRLSPTPLELCHSPCFNLIAILSRFSITHTCKCTNTL